ncbi:hypothetical protein BJL95_06675 [Methylomonas sp. LWB]|uniref:hypothetical protein n=1 Tax=Methylomonas sp. LWB TaxID=1905845 RepID=UPI0008D99176|nr:hypothetical protein [Methylomonas sp. LWB]OHX37964.1 hypothetical protein BJL95_06675 [Methylomonas sp. LWB]
MNLLNKHSLKAAYAGVLAISVFGGGLLTAGDANAALVSGVANMTIDNSAFTSAVGGSEGWYIANFWDETYNATPIDLDTTGGVALSQTETFSVSLPVNANGTTISYGARKQEATTMDASNTAAGQIGLSGAFRMEPAGGGSYLNPGDFYLKKASGTWNIFTYSAGFSSPAQDPALFRLVNATESVNGNGELSLSGDLYLSTLGYSWNLLFNGSTSVKVGTFNLAPAAVPLPAGVWLFGSGLVGLLGASRGKSGLSA